MLTLNSSSPTTTVVIQPVATDTRWQQEDVFLLTTLGSFALVLERNDASDPLYNVYCKTTTAKELWESLERKYKTEDAGVDNKLAQKDTYAPDSAKAISLTCIGSSSKYLAPKSWDCETEDSSRDLLQLMLSCAMISEVNLVERLTMDRSCIWATLQTAGDYQGKESCYYGWLLNKILAFRLVFESDKFVLSKNQISVEEKSEVNNVAPFAELCAKHGIRHEFTAPYSPQQNGIAERKNRTLKEMVTAMLISSDMSQDMWGEAILTATYLLNKIPRKEKEETPYELWMGRKPSYQYLRVWGCLDK
ncbi:retrotransposon protein, putative, ty1-copia subclass [Tanacetum coccineum]